MSDAQQPASSNASSGVPVPANYAHVLAEVVEDLRRTRLRVATAANTEMLMAYWRIGHTITIQQAEHGWGAKVIDRLAADLRREFPKVRGLSRSNLYSMRAFAQAWPSLGAAAAPDRSANSATSPSPAARAGQSGGLYEIVQTASGRITWSHVRVLVDHLDDQPTREWYAAQTAANGWSVRDLEYQIAIKLHARTAAAPSNFADRLPALDAGVLQQITKDPYVFDFLDMSEKKLEHDVEQALMDHLQATLTEFGRGFAFLGRQVSFDVGGDEFTVDLLFFHTQALAHVVVELKITKFKPADAGQLGFYVALVDDKLRNPAIHAPTVGILLCASRNEATVRYALGDNTAPMAVANFTDVPGLEQLHLPAPEELTAILAEQFDDDQTLADVLPDETNGDDDTDATGAADG